MSCKKVKHSLFVVFLVLGFVGCSPVKEEAKEKKVTAKQVSNELFEAVLSEDVASVKRLAYQENADLNLYDDEGVTALARAVQLKHYIIVDELIKAGAKIYQPFKRDSPKTAYSEVIKSETGILSLFEKESVRLGSELEALILKNNYSDAMSFSKANFLPSSLVMPNSKESTLDYALINADSKNDIDFLKYLIEKEKSNLESYSENLLKASSSLKEVSFLDYLIKSLGQSGKVYISEITTEDAKDIVWTTNKIKLLTASDLKIDLKQIESHLLNYDSSLQPKESHKYANLISSALENSQSVSERQALVKAAIESVSKKAESNLDYISWLQSVLNVWEGFGLHPTGYALDGFIFDVLSAIEAKPFDASSIEKALNSLSTFAPNVENHLEASFQKVLSGQFKDFQKVDLLDLLTKKVSRLPDNTLALAIEKRDIKSLSFLLDSSLLDKHSGQENAVLAAIRYTQSGDSAYSYLMVLKDKGIQFDTEYASQALSETLDRIITKSDRTYEGVLKVLISSDPSPLAKMDKKELLNFLAEILEKIRKEKVGLRYITQLLYEIPTETFNSSDIYERELQLENGKSPYKVKLSFTWDYILTMFEVFEVYSEDLDAMILSFNRVLQAFPNDELSISFDLETSGYNTGSYITQSILPLSLMLSLTKEEIENALKVEDKKTKSFAYKPQNVSWSVFTSNAFHEKYSKHKVFWETVTQTLLNSNKDFKIPKDKSSAQWLKVVLNTGQLSRYRGLVDQVKELSYSLPEEDRKCVFSKSNILENLNLGGLERRTDSHTGQVTIINNQQDWTSLGSFEALYEFKQRTCRGEKLNRKELEFIKSYIENHLSEPSTTSSRFYKPAPSYGVFKIQKVKCSEVDKQGHTYKQPYSWNYSPMGALSETAFSSVVGSLASNAHVIDFIAECHVAYYNSTIHEEAKRVFLNNWYQCSVDSDELDMVTYFQGIEDKYSLKPDSSDGEINICRF